MEREPKGDMHFMLCGEDVPVDFVAIVAVNDPSPRARRQVALRLATIHKSGVDSTKNIPANFEKVDKYLRACFAQRNVEVVETRSAVICNNEGSVDADVFAEVMAAGVEVIDASTLNIKPFTGFLAQHISNRV
eukprot:GILJ01023458.1.p2 GENE.GILJ01023458.1~~GILJ01023458.1.p2  ORF type:complete len:133 (+),score=19.25 GILJ01023458.1:899-1297(+)